LTSNGKAVADGVVTGGCDELVCTAVVTAGG